MAFYYSGYAIRGGDDHISQEESQRMAIKAVDEAIEIFTEVIFYDFPAGTQFGV